MSTPKYNLGDIVINDTTTWASIVSQDNYQYNRVGWYGVIVDRKLDETSGSGCYNKWGYKIEIEPGQYCCKEEVQISIPTTIPQEELIKLRSVLREAKLEKLL